MGVARSDIVDRERRAERRFKMEARRAQERIRNVKGWGSWLPQAGTVSGKKYYYHTETGEVNLGHALFLPARMHTAPEQPPSCTAIVLHQLGIFMCALRFGALIRAPLPLQVREREPLEEVIQQGWAQLNDRIESQQRPYKNRMVSNLDNLKGQYSEVFFPCS